MAANDKNGFWGWASNHWFLSFMLASSAIAAPAAIISAIKGGSSSPPSPAPNPFPPQSPPPPLASRPVTPPGALLALDGTQVKKGSVITVNALKVRSDLMPVLLKTNFQNGILVEKEHIDDTVVFKVTSIVPLQPVANEPSVMAVLFDARIGFGPNVSPAMQDLLKTMGNEIPLSAIVTSVNG